MKSLFIILLISFSLSEICSQSNWFNIAKKPQGNTYVIKFYDSNTGYAAGDQGMIIKSTNQGNDWQFLPTGTTKTIYAINLIDVNTLYACGDSGLVLYTTNGGNNWIQRNTGIINKLNAMMFYPSGYGMIAGNNGMLLKTSNGGLNWVLQALTTRNINSIHFIDSLKGFLGGDSGIFLKTINSGINWSSQFLFNYNIKTVQFLNVDTGFVAAGAIYRTINGGINWSSGIFYNNFNSIKMINKDTGYAVGNSSPLVRTINGGLNWMTIGPSNVYPPFSFYWLDVIGNKIFISGNNGYILRSTDGGSNVSYLGGTTYNLSGIGFINNNTGYIISNNLLISTTDGGAKWNINATGGNNWFEPNFTNYTRIKFSNPTNGYMSIYAYGGGGQAFSSYIRRSSDGGITWGNAYGSIFVYITDFDAFENSGIVIFSYPNNSSILRSNNGSPWVNQYTAPPPNYLTRISFHNYNTGFAIGNYNNVINVLVKTTNAGLNWSVGNQITPKQIKYFKLFPSGIGKIIGDSGLVITTADFGNSWSFYNGNYTFRYNDVYFLNETKGYGISTNNMLLHTSNGGLNWSSHFIDSNLTLNRVFFVSSDTGYIIGSNGVILKTTNGGLTFINNYTNNVPSDYQLRQNYPNPFNPVTNIKFEIPKSGFVKIIIYDLLGREITLLVNQQFQAGSYNVDWDATSYPSGVYFYRLVVGDNTNNGGFYETKKMVLIK